MVAPGLSFAEAEPGQDLHLTLDAAIQHIVERELARAVEERGASRGRAVFLDPRDRRRAGHGVLSRRSIPTSSARYPPARWRNRAIMDVYEPGSTFKIITAAAALGSGMVARRRTSSTARWAASSSPASASATTSRSAA